VQLKGLGQLKNLMTSSEIELAIFRLITWGINLLRYRAPKLTNRYLHNYSLLSIYLSVYPSIYLRLWSPFVAPWKLFQFLNPIHSRYDSLGRGISPSQDRYLHTEQHKHRIMHTDIHASSGIRTNDPSVRAALDRTATVMDN
jgi:hypothetical protein